MEKHILFLEAIKQSKLESLPRALRGKLPEHVINKILEEIDLVNEVIEHVRLYEVVQAKPDKVCRIGHKGKYSPPENWCNCKFKNDCQQTFDQLTANESWT